MNKQTVAETIIQIGTQGEQLLVNYLAHEPSNNMKLRTCLVRALALSNVDYASIDFVLEALYKASR